MQSPTPVWVTSILIMLMTVFVYVRTHEIPNQNPTSKVPKQTPISKVQYKNEFIVEKDLKWKVFISPDGEYQIDDTPLCAQHEQQLILVDDHLRCANFNDEGCKVMFDIETYDIRKQCAHSLGEKKYRQSTRPSRAFNLDV